MAWVSVSAVGLDRKEDRSSLTFIIDGCCWDWVM